MTDLPPPSAARPPRRSRRRIAVWIGVGAAVLSGSLLGLDRAAAVVIEHVTAGKVQKCLQTPKRPHVQLHDFPLLPHLVSGRLQHLTLTAHDINAKGVRVTELQVDAHGVSRHGAGGEVNSLRGTGLVSYDAISSNAMGLRVSYGGDGTIEVAGGIGALSGSGTLTPRIDNGDLVLQTGELSSPLFGNVDLQSIPPIRVPLRELPSGVNVTLNPSEQGLAFSFDGTHVEMADNICDMS
jgi:hypothetical protein